MPVVAMVRGFLPGWNGRSPMGGAVSQSKLEGLRKVPGVAHVEVDREMEAI
jgi:hypothetical protein